MHVCRSAGFFFVFQIWTVLNEQLVLQKVDFQYMTARIWARRPQGNSIVSQGSSLFRKWSASFLQWLVIFLNLCLPPIIVSGLTPKYSISQSALWINFSSFYAPGGTSGLRLLEALKNRWLYMQWLLHFCCWMILVCASNFANDFRIPLSWEGLVEYKISLAMVITFYLSNALLPGSSKCLVDVISEILLWGQEHIFCYLGWAGEKMVGREGRTPSNIQWERRVILNRAVIWYFLIGNAKSLFPEMLFLLMMMMMMTIASIDWVLTICPVLL